MIRKTSIMLLIFCFLISYQPYAQTERDTLFYEIQPEMIAQARVEKMDMKVPEYFIHILLKEDYHTEYEQLTDDNIGNLLAVVYKGEIISPTLPAIQAKISNGRFLIGSFKKKERAKNVKQQILNEN